MSYFLLLIIGFIFATYIYKARYSALNHVNEFILCLERMRSEKLFRYEEKTILADLQHFDLDAQDFGTDILDSFRKNPKILAGDLYIRREKILPFLRGAYFPNDEYFRITTDIIYDLLRDCDSTGAKRSFIVEFLSSNHRVRDMATSVRRSGHWSLDEKSEEQTRVKLNDSILNLDDGQLDQMVLTFLSIAKMGLIALTESIKEKYVESRSRRAIKRAGIAFMIMLLFQGTSYFVWHLDLLNWFAMFVAGSFGGTTIDY